MKRRVRRWNAHVVSDPERGFGVPCIEGTHIRAVNVADMYRAEGGDEMAMRLTCQWFRISAEQVQAALDYCERFREIGAKRGGKV